MTQDYEPVQQDRGSSGTFQTTVASPPPVTYVAAPSPHTYQYGHAGQYPPPAYGQNVTVVQMQSGIDMQMLHVVSIICCILSLFLSPLIELIPMVLYCVYRPDRHSTPASRGLLTGDLICTWIVFIIWLVLNLLLTIFSFGILIFLFLFQIPYIFVIIFLQRARKQAVIVHVTAAHGHTHGPVYA